MFENSISNPFLFLQPYGLKDKFNLKGRNDEALSLLALLKWKDIIVVYGKSGVGKTSFINYALSSKINRVNWLPIRITRLLNINHSFQKSISYALQAKSVDQIHNEVIDKDGLLQFDIAPGEDVSVNESVQLVKKLCVKWNRPVYLIIDQLEELFLIGGNKEQNDFLTTLQLLMDSTDIQKKIILVLREEHLSFIQEIERILNGVFQDALAVKEIKKEEGARIYDSLINSPDPACSEPLFDFAKKIADEKLKIIESCTLGDTFDAQKLQILLFLLWEYIYGNIISETDTDITKYVEQLCNAGYPLRDYLEGTINAGLAKNARLLMAPYWFVLRNSISEANTKKPVSLSELYKLLVEELIMSLPNNYAVTPQYNEVRPGYKNNQREINNLFKVNKDDVKYWCEKLSDKRIMERLPVNETGSEPEQYYQLKHDTLVSAIKALDTKFPLRFPKNVPVDEQFINPYQGLKQYDYEENKKDIKRTGLRSAKSKNNISKLYGREVVIKEYVEFLTRKEIKCLVVVGDSGTGKSSLVKGGLLPAMQAAGYNTKTLQPGPDLERFREEIIAFINESNYATTSNPTLKNCLYIDQFEECYTFRGLTDNEEQKFHEFLNFLHDEIDNLNDSLKLIVSIRHDYAHEFDRNISQWRKFKKLLRYPNQDEIFDIIVGPAFDKGISFEPADLPERIAADATNTSYFLPLLSFAMQTLYNHDIKNKIPVLSNLKTISLTSKGYEEIGGIVNCLQKQFTDTYDPLTGEDKSLFSELMARMIVIKDTIPKAQPLAISRINYVEPGKVDRALHVLKCFKPEFLREREIKIQGVPEPCYEPIHDSLLIYCDEIRQIIIKVQAPDSQMYLQPRIESAVKEWKAATSDMQEKSKKSREEEITISEANDSTAAGNAQVATIEKNDKEGYHNKLVEIIQKRYKELEPLYDFLKDKANYRRTWLFKDEFELVEEGKKYADQFKNAETLATTNKLQELMFQKQEQKLRQELLKAEHEKLKVEQERSFEEGQKKEQVLLAQTFKVQAEAQRRKQWIVVLVSILLVAGAGAFILFKKDKLENKTMSSIIARIREDSTKLSDNSIDLIKANKLNELKNHLLLAKNDTLKQKDSVNNGLIADLHKNEKDMKELVKKLLQIRDELTEAGKSKDLAIKEKNNYLEGRDKAIARLENANKSLKAALIEVDSLKNVRLNTLAELSKRASPATSYRLAEEALKVKADDSIAAKIKSSLENKPQYFESLIVNNVVYQSVSRDGSRIVTVQSDSEYYSKSNIRVWDTYGNQDGKTIIINSKITFADISSNNKNILLGNDNSIRIFDLQSKQLGSIKPVSNLLYIHFAETDDRFFTISNENPALKQNDDDNDENSDGPDKIRIYKLFSNEIAEVKSIPFESGGVINNAKLLGNNLVIITARGISHLETTKGRKVSTKELPQSFILNSSTNVLSLENPTIGKYRRLVLFDSTMRQSWSKKVPDKNYNLITRFVNSTDGRFGVIQFNEKEKVVLFAQQQQQQLQQQQRKPLIAAKNSKADTNRYQNPDKNYYLDLRDGKLTSVNVGSIGIGAFILSANNDSIFEYSSGSIIKLPINKNTTNLLQTHEEIFISENKRFRNVSLVGLNKDLILSYDANGQLKLWRFGKAGELDNRKQLWKLSKEELEKITGIR